MSDLRTDRTPPYVALVVAPDPAWRQQSIQAVGAHAEPLEVPNLETARTTIATTPVNMVIFGPGTGISVEAHIAPLLEQHPNLGVLLIMDDLGIEGLRAAMHAGVREVLPADTGIRELSEAVERLRNVVSPLPAHAPPTRRRHTGISRRDHGRLVMICSAKGGTGVSTVAINLAAALARTGRSVTLCDADPVFGDLPLLLGMKSRAEIEPGDLPKRLQPDEVAAELTRHEPTGVRLFTMFRARMPLNELPGELVMATFEGLQAASDIVIVDMPAPLVNIAEYLVHADELFFVAGTDVASLKNLRLARQLMDNAGLPVNRSWMVLNRIRNYADFEPAGYTQIVGLPVVCAVPDSTALVNAGDHAEVLVHSSPREQASRAFTKFAQDLAGRFDRIDSGVTP